MSSRKKKRPETAAAREKKKAEKAAAREAKLERQEEIYKALAKQPLVPTGHSLKTIAGEAFTIGKTVSWMPVDAGEVTSIAPKWARMPDRPTAPGEASKSGLVKQVNPHGEEVAEWAWELVTRIYHAGPYFHDILPNGTRITAKLVPESREVERVNQRAIEDIEATRTDAGDKAEDEDGGTPLSTADVDELLDDLTRKDDVDGAKMIQRMARKSLGPMPTEEVVIAEVERARAALTPDAKEE